MQPITRREFVKRTAVAGAMLTSIPAILEACSTGTPTSNKPSKLTIAAVQGAEDGPLKKVAPMYQSQTGITMEIVQKFNKANFYGYVIRGKATNPASSDSLPILWSFGGDIFDTSWKVVLDSTASIDAITFLTQTLKKYAEPGAENTDAGDRDRLIAIGQAFQSTTWPAEVTGVVEAAGVSQVAGKMAYIPIPKGPSGKGLGMMGNWLLGIPKGSSNGSAAADFIKWLIKTENMKTYVQNGGIPTRTSLLNDSTLGQSNPRCPALPQSLSP